MNNVPEFHSDRIAFHGGVQTNQLGPVEDVVCFFDLLKTFAAPSLDEGGRILLLDRLYRRYVRFEETHEAVKAMRVVQHQFANIPTKNVDWAALGFGDRYTSLKLDTETLADVTGRYFAYFVECAESALYFSEKAAVPTLRPVRVARSGFAGMMREKSRPLADYDNLQGPPFWLDPHDLDGV